MNNKEIRWRQRFENLLRAYTKFKSAVDAFDSLSMLEKEGLIQRFEYTLELSWKTVKDYLESQEVMAIFPKEVIKAAFHYEIIEDGDVWME
ncbi:nucleotidyltransferase, partial [Coprococcus sp. MSK.21.13]|nr:nucleotidyltransferase [Coprococcus sp. MSK.21.13]